MFSTYLPKIVHIIFILAVCLFFILGYNSVLFFIVAFYLLLSLGFRKIKKKFYDDIELTDKHVVSPMTGKIQNIEKISE